MATANGLSDPSVELNSVGIEIIPGTLSLKTGRGDRTVRTQSAGGGAVSVVVTDNVETQKGMVKFSLSNTAYHQELIRTANSPAGNTIRIYQDESVYNFSSMHIIAEPEWVYGADSSVEISFEGPPAV